MTTLKTKRRLDSSVGIETRQRAEKSVFRIPVRAIYIYIYIYIYLRVCVCVCALSAVIGTRHPNNREAASPLDRTAAGIGIVQYYFIQSVIVHLRYLWNNMTRC